MFTRFACHQKDPGMLPAHGGAYAHWRYTTGERLDLLLCGVHRHRFNARNAISTT